MFEIGWSEILLIAVVAIIVIGPKELPAVLRGLGRTVTKLRRSADDFRRQFEESIKESGYEDVQRDLQAIRRANPATQIRDSIDDALRGIDTPVSGAVQQPQTPMVDLPPVEGPNPKPAGEALPQQTEQRNAAPGDGPTDEPSSRPAPPLAANDSAPLTPGSEAPRAASQN